MQVRAGPPKGGEKGAGTGSSPTGGTLFYLHKHHVPTRFDAYLTHSHGNSTSSASDTSSRFPSHRSLYRSRVMLADS